MDDDVAASWLSTNLIITIGLVELSEVDDKEDNIGRRG
jgi:hypothetical protein